VGLAINPLTLLRNALPYLDDIDLLLCMTVNPGFGGQAFMSEVLDKVREARHYARDRQLELHIEVDGGIDSSTAAEAAAAGANVLVAGTSLYGAEDMKEAVREMRQSALEANAAG
jgi:ribulose-phosphate 3-epimerase